LRPLVSTSLLLACGCAWAQVPDAPVSLVASDGFGFGARWRVEFDRDTEEFKAGQTVECRVEEPPDDRPRAVVVCTLPDGRKAQLAEPDGRAGVLPVDVHVRSLRLLLSQATR